MLDELVDPDAPAPDGAAYQAVLDRAGHVRSVRRLRATTTALIVVAGAVLVAQIPGGTERARVVTRPAPPVSGEGSDVRPSETAATDAPPPDTTVEPETTTSTTSPTTTTTVVSLADCRPEDWAVSARPEKPSYRVGEQVVVWGTARNISNKHCKTPPREYGVRVRDSSGRVVHEVTWDESRLPSGPDPGIRPEATRDVRVYWDQRGCSEPAAACNEQMPPGTYVVEPLWTFSTSAEVGIVV